MGVCVCFSGYPFQLGLNGIPKAPKTRFVSSPHFDTYPKKLKESVYVGLLLAWVDPFGLGPELVSQDSGANGRDDFSIEQMAFFWTPREPQMNIPMVDLDRAGCLLVMGV